MKTTDMKSFKEIVKKIILKEFEVGMDGEPKHKDQPENYHKALTDNGYSPEDNNKELWGKTDHKGYSQVNIDNERGGWTKGNWESEDPDLIGHEDGREEFHDGENSTDLDKHLREFHKLKK